MNITTARLNAVLASLHEVGHAALDPAEQAICAAFNDGTLRVCDDLPAPRVFGEPSDEEFEPRDHNDADGVQTMRDFQ